MIEEFKSIKSTKKELREFGLLVGGILVAIALFGLWVHRPWAPPVLVIGAALAVVGALAPKLLLPAQKAWMALAVVLGAVMSRVILTLLFYLVLTPVSLVARATGKRFLETGFRDGSESYWVLREGAGQTKDDIERQF